MSVELNKASKTKKSGANPLMTAGELFAKVMDSEAAHTSFGKLVLAPEKSAPQFSFGTGERFNTNKFYLSKEMATAQITTKWSPGPIYQVSADAKYLNPPKFGFGTSKRNPLDIKAPYYEEAATDDPVNSDHVRKPRCQAPKFGTAPKLPVYVGSKSADHQYYPERPDFKKSPKFSLGSRRDNEPGVLTTVTSTPGTVGPSTYMPENVTKVDKWKQGSKWTFPQANRQELYMKKDDRHQTYDTRKAIGKQSLSTKKTAPQFKLGLETRETRQKTGMFKGAMTQQPIKVHLPHPTF